MPAGIGGQGKALVEEPARNSVTGVIIRADLCLMIAILAVTIPTGRYAMLAPTVVGLTLLPLAARTWKKDRQRVERAHQLNV